MLNQVDQSILKNENSLYLKIENSLYFNFDERS